MENKNLRNICLNMISDTLDKGQLSHHVISETFDAEGLDKSQRSYIKRMYSGTLEKLIYLDYIIGKYSAVPMKKMKPAVRNILRIGLYQLKFMDSVPDYSVIDESVKLTRKRGLNNLCPFVNAVLRKAQRESDSLILPEHVKALVPLWLFDLMTEQYGSERAAIYFESLKQEKNETFVWYNLKRAQEDQITQLLREEGCAVNRIVIPGTESPIYSIGGFDSLTQLSAFRQGLICVQDPSSVLSVLDAVQYISENRLTIDVCAAPGGKSLIMARSFPESRILSRDVSDAKIRLIRQNTERLGAGNITAQVRDALETDLDYLEKADVVIADLPCSGLGVAGRKADILYRLKETDLKELADLQKKILSVCKQYVKPGGILIFSTCTVNKGENEENTKWFLQDSRFRLLKEQALLNGEWKFDGFYYAYFRKN